MAIVEIGWASQSLQCHIECLKVCSYMLSSHVFGVKLWHSSKKQLTTC